MAVQAQLCFLLFGTCLFSFLLLLECRMLEGYAFSVYSTKECPENQAEWKNRSSAINCTESNGYMCLPNENFTDLLEFCYLYPRILVQKGLCLYLVQRLSRVNSYNCSKFKHGCPELNYFSSESYVHPSCMEIENGCFSAEPSCKRQPVQSKNSNDDTPLAIVLGVFIPACLLCILVFYVIRKKFGICKRGSDTVRADEETQLLPCGYEQREPMDNNKDGEAKDMTNRYEAKTNAGYGTCWIDREHDGELKVDLDRQLVIPNIMLTTRHSTSVPAVKDTSRNIADCDIGRKL